MRRILIVFLVLSVVLSPIVKVQAHGPDCSTFSDNENGLYRLFARWQYLLGQYNTPRARGAKAIILYNPLQAEHILNSYNHADHVLWLHTDVDKPGGHFVEVGLRDYVNDPADKPPEYTVYEQQFYWFRLITVEVDGGLQERTYLEYETLSLPNLDTRVRYWIGYNSSAGGYDITIQRGSSDSKNFVGRSLVNGLRPWMVRVGSESNYCDGNDGDSSYNFISPTRTDDWDWIEDGGTYHAITIPDAPESDIPAHMDIYDPGRDAACFHMNTTYWC